MFSIKQAKQGSAAFLAIEYCESRVHILDTRKKKKKKKIEQYAIAMSVTGARWSHQTIEQNNFFCLLLTHVNHVIMGVFSAYLI